MARQNGPVGVRCAPVWCTGCMCLPTAPGAISGRASGVQALQVSHPGSRYPGWCTVVQRCQEWLAKAGTSPARLETRTKESIGGRRQCCACSQSWYGATGGGARCAATLAGFGLRDPTQAWHAAVPNVAWLKRTDDFLCGATLFHRAFGDSEERVAMPLGTLRRGAASWIHAGSMVLRAACFSMACNGKPI